MSYRIAVIAWLVFLGPTVVAQEASFEADFSAIKIHRSSVLKVDFNGRPVLMLKADFTLISGEEDGDLRIQGDEINFVYGESAGTQPTQVIIIGNVRLEHPSAVVTSEKAEFHFDVGLVNFTGSPILYNQRTPEGVQTTRIELDLNTELISMFEAAGDLSFASEKKAAEALLLIEKDISDWKDFLTTLRDQAAAQSPSPGRHILSLMDSQVRETLRAQTVEVLEGNKDQVLEHLNKLLDRSDFYVKTKWGPVSVPAELASMMETDPDKLSSVQQVWLNRSLMHEAYPQLVASPPALPE